MSGADKCTSKESNINALLKMFTRAEDNQDLGKPQRSEFDCDKYEDHDDDGNASQSSENSNSDSDSEVFVKRRAMNKNAKHTVPRANSCPPLTRSQEDCCVAGSSSKFTWSQNCKEVHLNLQLPRVPDIEKKLVVEVTSDKLVVRIDGKGTPLLEGYLHQQVRTKEVYWNIVSAENEQESCSSVVPESHRPHKISREQDKTETLQIVLPKTSCTYWTQAIIPILPIHFGFSPLSSN